MPGVAEVGLAGGTPREYQIDIDPNSLRAYGVTLGDLHAAVARSNLTVGGRVLHKNGAEYAVRGVGYLGASKVGSKLGLQQITVQVGSLGGAAIGTPQPIKVVVNGVASNVDQTFTLKEGTLVLGTGEVVLTNWEKDARVSIADEKIEATNERGPGTRCKAWESFKMKEIGRAHV